MRKQIVVAVVSGVLGGIFTIVALMVLINSGSDLPPWFPVSRAQLADSRQASIADAREVSLRLTTQLRSEQHVRNQEQDAALTRIGQLLAGEIDAVSEKVDSIPKIAAANIPAKDRCPTCKGRGKIMPFVPALAYSRNPWITCSDCNGTGVRVPN